MQVSIKELRKQPGRIISMASAGNSITITKRGLPAAKIVPLDAPAQLDNTMLAFGMWEDREDMQDPSTYVADLRKGRSL